MDPENARFARNALESEISHRHEKLWKIFSWAATLLVGIIGGIIALKTDRHRECALTPQLKLAILLAVGVLTAYSSLWITQNLGILHEAKTRQKIYDKLLEIDSVPLRPAPFGYRWAIIMLAAGAVLALYV